MIWAEIIQGITVLPIRYMYYLTLLRYLTLKVQLIPRGIKKTGFWALGTVS